MPASSQKTSPRDFQDPKGGGASVGKGFRRSQVNPSNSHSFLDFNAEDNDPFIKYWIKVYGNQRSGDLTESEGNDCASVCRHWHKREYDV
jgi:hypothetical protein